MKTNFFIASAVFLALLIVNGGASMGLAVAASIGKRGGADEVQACFKTAMTQPEMNKCAGLEYVLADKELNAVYQEVAKRRQNVKGFVARLKEAQQAWLKWRDAEMEAIYPERNDPSAYGTVFAMCWELDLASLTRERTKQLRKWLVGVEEGGACSGSFPLKNSEN